MCINSDSGCKIVVLIILSIVKFALELMMVCMDSFPSLRRAPVIELRNQMVSQATRTFSDGAAITSAHHPLIGKASAKVPMPTG